MGTESATRGPISSGRSDVPDVTRTNIGSGALALTHGSNANWIGDDYIQGKGYCTKATGPDCFLNESNRGSVASMDGD